MLFEGKNLYGQYIDCSKEKKMPKGFICPYTGTIFYNIRIYSRSQVSVYRTIGPLVLIFAPKHRLWVLAEAVLTCTHNLCFEHK